MKRFFFVGGVLLFLICAFYGCSASEKKPVIFRETGEEQLDKIELNVYSDTVGCTVTVLERENGTMELCAIENSEYLFIGWYIEEDVPFSTDNLVLIDPEKHAYADYVFNGMLSVCARFRPAACIVYDLAGGGAESLPQKVDTSEKNFVLPTDVYKNGHSFAGWSDSAGNRIEVLPKGTTGQISLRACWVLEPMEVLSDSAWETDAPIPLISTLFPIMTVSSSHLFFFDSDGTAEVYAEMDGKCVQISYIYTQWIHFMDYMNRQREAFSSNSEQMTVYNVWKMDLPRYAQGVHFTYTSRGDMVYVYAQTKDPRYARYIKQYFSHALFVFRLDSEGQLSFCSSVPADLAIDDEDIFYDYYDLYAGLMPAPLSSEVELLGTETPCVRRESNDRGQLTLWDTELGDFGEQILLDQSGAYVLSKSNLLSPPFTPLMENSDDSHFVLASKVFLRNFMTLTPVFLRDGEEYRVMFFSPIFCMTGQISTSAHSGKVEAYVSTSEFGGVQVLLMDRDSNIQIGTLYDFSEVYATDSDWAAKHKWKLHEAQ